MRCWFEEGDGELFLRARGMRVNGELWSMRDAEEEE